MDILNSLHMDSDFNKNNVLVWNLVLWMDIAFIFLIFFSYFYFTKTMSVNDLTN